MCEETYVTFDQAQALKRLGFDWKCEEYIRQAGGSPSTGIRWVSFPRPRIDFAAKWLREVKGLAVNVIAHDGGMYEFDIVFLPNAEDIEGYLDRSPFCETYEEALSEGITAALKYLEELQ